MNGRRRTLGVSNTLPGVPGQVPVGPAAWGYFFNIALTGKLDPLQPQVPVYEPVGGRLLRLRSLRILDSVRHR